MATGGGHLHERLIPVPAERTCRLPGVCSTRPQRSRAPRSWSVIHEIQRSPQLPLVVHHDPVHPHGVERSEAPEKGTDPLGRRLVVREMRPYLSGELGRDFWPERALSVGTVPLVVVSPAPADTLADYVALYLRGEVQAEGLVRTIGGFSRFLGARSHRHAWVLVLRALPRKCELGRGTTEGYVSVLQDVLGWLSPAPCSGEGQSACPPPMPASAFSIQGHSGRCGRPDLRSVRRGPGVSQAASDAPSGLRTRKRDRRRAGNRGIDQAPPQADPRALAVRLRHLQSCALEQVRVPPSEEANSVPCRGYASWLFSPDSRRGEKTGAKEPGFRGGAVTSEAANVLRATWPWRVHVAGRPRSLHAQTRRARGRPPWNRQWLSRPGAVSSAVASIRTASTAACGYRRRGFLRSAT